MKAPLSLDQWRPLRHRATFFAHSAKLRSRRHDCVLRAQGQHDGAKRVVHAVLRFQKKKALKNISRKVASCVKEEILSNTVPSEIVAKCMPKMKSRDDDVQVQVSELY